jgi:hypothetical protein
MAEFSGPKHQARVHNVEFRQLIEPIQKFGATAVTPAIVVVHPVKARLHSLVFFRIASLRFEALVSTAAPKARRLPADANGCD